MTQKTQLSRWSVSNLITQIEALALWVWVIIMEKRVLFASYILSRYLREEECDSLHYCFRHTEQAYTN